MIVIFIDNSIPYIKPVFVRIPIMMTESMLNVEFVTIDAIFVHKHHPCVFPVHLNPIDYMMHHFIRATALLATMK